MVQVIPEKITPPQQLPRVSRERLLSRLSESLEGCNSTIIQARAGAGKTMLATEFARRAGRRVAWYKLDAPDSELPLFLRHLCASLAAARPGFGAKTLERLGRGLSTGDVPLAVEYLVYELLESSEPLLLVIDDLHLIYDAEWMAPFFRRLLPLLPREVHVVLLGRGLPPAPLWRMRSKQTLRVVDESALNFTTDEAERLYASYGLPTKLAAQALAESWGRAAALDALARGGQTRAEERASRTIGVVVESLGDARQQRAPQLRLVKGYAPKSSAGVG